MSDATKVLDLWALDQPLEPVRFVKDGDAYPMQPIDGVAEQLAFTMGDQTPAEKRATLGQIVQRCLPDAPPELIAACTIEKLDLLVALASRQVRTVEEYLGKYPAGAAAGASPSATPSGTPSPASPAPSAGAPSSSGAGPTG